MRRQLLALIIAEQAATGDRLGKFPFVGAQNKQRPRIIEPHTIRLAHLHIVKSHWDLAQVLRMGHQRIEGTIILQRHGLLRQHRCQLVQNAHQHIPSAPLLLCQRRRAVLRKSCRQLLQMLIRMVGFYGLKQSGADLPRCGAVHFLLERQERLHQALPQGVDPFQLHPVAVTQRTGKALGRFVKRSLPGSTIDAPSIHIIFCTVQIRAVGHIGQAGFDQTEQIVATPAVDHRSHQIHRKDQDRLGGHRLPFVCIIRHAVFFKS